MQHVALARHAPIARILPANRPRVPRSPGATLAKFTVCGFAIFFSIFPALGEAAWLESSAAILKYTFSASLWLSVTLLVSQYGKVNYFPSFLAAPLLLSIIGLVAFLGLHLLSPGRTSYGSALIPLLVCAVPMFVPSSETEIDPARSIHFYTLLLLAASLSHLVWQAVFVVLQGDDTLLSHERTFVMVALMIVAGFRGSWILFALSLCLIGGSTILRPSSTLAAGASVALLAVAVYRVGLCRLCRWITLALTYGVIALNIIVVLSAPFAELVFGVEPLVKQDVLGSDSNSGFRLGVIEALRADMEQHPLLTGKMFSGDINPEVSDYLQWWSTDQAPIHSDFAVVLSQGGLFGYALFAAIFIGLAHACYRTVSCADRRGIDRHVAAFFDAVPVITLVFIIYISFNPIMANIALSLFFLMLVPLSVLTARRVLVLELPARSTGPRAQPGPKRSGTAL